MQEDCGVCGKTVPFSVTAHVMLNPPDDEPVRDCYVCRSCYEDRVEPLFTDLADSEE